MYALSNRRRAFWLSVCLPPALLVLNSGAGCFTSVNLPPVVTEEPPGTTLVPSDAFGIDLLNDTTFTVDPGVSVDQFVLNLGTLAPLEGSDVPVSFDVDCVSGDTLTIDPTLFLAGGVQVLAANGPVTLVEGTDYSCGDIISLDFSQGTSGTFFVDVFVNGTLFNP